MTERIEIHPVNPQPRRVREVAAVLRDGGLIAYPTDSSYALGSRIGDQQAAGRIARIRDIDKSHNFTLVCRDLSEIAAYARVDNWAYRLLRAHTPGPYTFILRATRDVPRRLQNPRQKTIGIRVPDHPVPLAIAAELGGPIMSSTLIMPGDTLPLHEPEDILDALAGQVDLIVDGGHCGIEPSTVVDLTGDYAVILREGKGPVDHFI